MDGDNDDLLNPGDPFPGWEYLVPLVRPRTDTLLSLMPEGSRRAR